MIENSDESDAKWMIRLRDGDDLALNELMNRWQVPLIRFIYRHTANEATALDLAEETFVRIYQHRRKFDGRGKFSTWLFTIANNLCRNHARWRARHPTISMDQDSRREGGISLGSTLKDNSHNPVQDAEGHELGGAIREAIQQLPEDQRTATILHEYEQMGYAEIAKVLGCSEKAVENRLYRARQTLREKLAKWLE